MLGQGVLLLQGVLAHWLGHPESESVLLAGTPGTDVDEDDDRSHTLSKSISEKDQTGEEIKRPKVAQNIGKRMFHFKLC